MQGDLLSPEEMDVYIAENNVTCPHCKSNTFTATKQFNLMFKTTLGATDDELAYLRPETAQGAYINFGNVLQSSRKKLPFGMII